MADDIKNILNSSKAIIILIFSKSLPNKYYISKDTKIILFKLLINTINKANLEYFNEKEKIELVDNDNIDTINPIPNKFQLNINDPMIINYLSVIIKSIIQKKLGEDIKKINNEINNENLDFNDDLPFFIYAILNYNNKFSNENEISNTYNILLQLITTDKNKRKEFIKTINTYVSNKIKNIKNIKIPEFINRIENKFEDKNIDIKSIFKFVDNIVLVKVNINDNNLTNTIENYNPPIIESEQILNTINKEQNIINNINNNNEININSIDENMLNKLNSDITTLINNNNELSKKIYYYNNNKIYYNVKDYILELQENYLNNYKYNNLDKYCIYDTYLDYNNQYKYLNSIFNKEQLNNFIIFDDDNYKINIFKDNKLNEEVSKNLINILNNLNIQELNDLINSMLTSKLKLNKGIEYLKINYNDDKYKINDADNKIKSEIKGKINEIKGKINEIDKEKNEIKNEDIKNLIKYSFNIKLLFNYYILNKLNNLKEKPEAKLEEKPEAKLEEKPEAKLEEKPEEKSEEKSKEKLELCEEKEFNEINDTKINLINLYENKITFIKTNINNLDQLINKIIYLINILILKNDFVINREKSNDILIFNKQNLQKLNNKITIKINLEKLEKLENQENQENQEKINNDITDFNANITKFNDNITNFNNTSSNLINKFIKSEKIDIDTYKNFNLNIKNAYNTIIDIINKNNIIKIINKNNIKQLKYFISIYLFCININKENNNEYNIFNEIYNEVIKIKNIRDNLIYSDELQQYSKLLKTYNDLKSKYTNDQFVKLNELNISLIELKHNIINKILSNYVYLFNN